MKVYLAVASYKGLGIRQALADVRAGKPLNQATKDKLPFFSSLAGTMELLEAHGHEAHFGSWEGCCYVQQARNELVRLFMETDCDTLFFLDDDVSWEPKDALRLIEMPDEVLAAAYPHKTRVPSFPALIRVDGANRPIVRQDGCIAAVGVAAGFLSIKRSVIEKLRAAYPNLKYSHYRNGKPAVGEFYDLFPQGVYEGRWVGEDYAFCRLWNNVLGTIWIVPDMWLTHWDGETPYRGNYHEFLMCQPGGSKQKWDLTRADAIEGWMAASELEWLAEQASKHSRIVEIGSHLGRSTRAMADNTTGVVLAIDHWCGPRKQEANLTDDERGNLWALFQENLKDHIANKKVMPIRVDHEEPSMLIVDSGWPDMVFIDGDHAYESVKRDIQNWISEIQPGGLLCGHDYNWPEVQKGVDELLPGAKQAEGTQIWYWQVPVQEEKDVESHVVA